jgi:hypothetical protein
VVADGIPAVEGAGSVSDAALLERGARLDAGVTDRRGLDGVGLGVPMRQVLLAAMQVRPQGMPFLQFWACASLLVVSMSITAEPIMAPRPRRDSTPRAWAAATTPWYRLSADRARARNRVETLIAIVPPYCSRPS